MKLIIDIPKEYYEALKEMSDETLSIIDRAIIRYGTPLPEKHGRLIDEQQIIDRFKPIEKFKHWRIGTDGLFIVLSDAPTIIEGSDAE